MAKPTSLILECPYCKANVQGTVLGSHDSFDPDQDPTPFRAILMECSACKNTLFAGQYEEYDPSSDNAYFGTPWRLWPSPKRSLSWEIPPLVRTSLDEADRCLKAGAFIASAAMSGRALEGICRHFKTKSQYLSGGLKELLEKEVIDKRLFKWSQELQEHRNIAAHATDARINSQDAESLLELVVAICDYVFVLSEKFNQFMSRKAKNAEKKKP
jgi:hypothetical protein